MNFETESQNHSTCKKKSVVIKLIVTDQKPITQTVGKIN